MRTDMLNAAAVVQVSHFKTTEFLAPKPVIKKHGDAVALAFKCGGIGGIEQGAGLPVCGTSREQRYCIRLPATGNLCGIMEHCIAAGLPLDSATSEGITPLHNAAMNGHADAALMLIDRGAKVNARQPGGATALHNAALWGHSALVRVLHSWGRHTGQE